MKSLSPHSAFSLFLVISVSCGLFSLAPKRVTLFIFIHPLIDLSFGFGKMDSGNLKVLSDYFFLFFTP